LFPTDLSENEESGVIVTENAKRLKSQGRSRIGSLSRQPETLLLRLREIEVYWALTWHVDCRKTFAGFRGKFDS
jgi:hypothetical protein